MTVSNDATAGSPQMFTLSHFAKPLPLPGNKLNHHHMCIGTANMRSLTLKCLCKCLSHQHIDAGLIAHVLSTVVDQLAGIQVMHNSTVCVCSANFLVTHRAVLAADASDTEKDLSPLARANSENPWGPKRSGGSFSSGVSGRARGDSSPRLRNAYAEIQIKVTQITIAVLRFEKLPCQSISMSLLFIMLCSTLTWLHSSIEVVKGPLTMPAAMCRCRQPLSSDLRSLQTL